MFDKYRWTNVSEIRNQLTLNYEPIQLDVLRSLVRRLPRCTFLDIGANIGAYSVIIANEPNVFKVYAFEPVPSLIKELRINFSLNHLESKVDVHEVVLSNESGEASFVVRSEHAGDGGVLETHQFKSLPYKSIELFKKDALDNILSMENENLVCKIDVEGHELEVLQGAERTLKKNKGYLQIETLNANQAKAVEHYLATHHWFFLFRLGNDSYFSNIEGLNKSDCRLSILEDGLTQFIERTKNGEGAPVRRKVIKGVTLEIKREYAKMIARLIFWK